MTYEGEMRKLLSVPIALVALIGCNEPRVNISSNKSGLDKSFIPDIEERLSVCRSRGERLVRVPDQFGANQNYFACAENSWDCVPVTLYENTPNGYRIAILIDHSGEVEYYRGKSTIPNENYKCTPPRKN